MANRSAPLINVGEEANKPQGLRGLHQQVRGQWQCSRITARRWSATGGEGGAYLIHGTRAERGKPVSLPSGKGRRKASREGCGEGTQKKRTPSCHEMEREPEPAAPSLPAQVG